MDSLAGLEPQLAIPVILVVVGAILVYIFGFKQTEEPSYEHLAVLQSSSSFHKTRSAPSNNPKQSNKTSASSKVKANGHLPMANGVKKAAVAAINKENKPPATSAAAAAVKGAQATKKNAKDPANKPEDFESGEWIPAVSRKEKVKKEKKEAPSSPGKRGGSGYTKASASALENWETTTTTTPVVKAPKIEDLLAEMNVLKEIERQNQGSAPASPEKKKAAAAPAAVTSSPTKGKNEKVAAAAKVTPPAPVAAAAAAQEEEEEKVTPPAQEKKAAAAAPGTAPKKSNIAFDEMGGGDSWEEAKSRGAKKRTRARKD